MRVLLAAVHLQLRCHLPAHLALGKHAPNSQFHQFLGVQLLHRLERIDAATTGVAGIGIVFEHIRYGSEALVAQLKAGAVKQHGKRGGA